MNTLLIEILAYLLAAAFLSLFIGWVIRGAFAQKEVKTMNTTWEGKISSLEAQHKQDTLHLENQVARLDSESNQLANRNDSINESLRENELSVHQARADAIELNRQQADTQERLQRIIAQKDEELKLFRNNSAKTNNVQAIAATGTGTDSGTGTGTSTSLAAVNVDATEAKIASLSAKREAWESERQRLIKSMGDEQETIAIDPADLPTESLDKTVRIAPEQAMNLKSLHAKQRETHDLESDKTMTIDNDQTVLLDNNTNININKPQNPANDEPKPGDNDS